MPRTYTGVQARAANLWQSDAQIHIGHGPFQCGKSASMIDGFVMGALMRGGTYILGAPTLDQANDVLVKHIVGNHPDALRKSPPGGELHVGDVVFQIRAGKTKGSHSKIKGKTLQGAFLDEITDIDHEFYNQILGRCSQGVPGKVVATCNPDGAEHWVKKDLVDKAETDPDIEEYGFTIDDNPTLSEKFKDGLKKRYTGVWLRRYYYGEWVSAEGAIYPTVGQCVAPTPKGTPRAVWLAGDWGDADPTHFVRVEEHEDGVRYISQEWRWDNDAGHLDEAEKAQGILSKLGHGTLTAIHVDPSAIGLLTALDRATPVPVSGAENAVVTGIQQTRAMFELGRLKIDKDKCPETYRELLQYRWTESTMKGANTTPDHDGSHAPDAVRYHVASTLRADWYAEDW